jgi:hypothetical protein
MACVTATASIAYFLGIWYENRKRDSAMPATDSEATEANNQGAESELGDDKEVLGDLSQAYRYMY